MNYGLVLAEGSLALALAQRRAYTTRMNIDDKPYPLSLYLTVAEAAALLGITGQAVRAQLAAGTLEGEKVGRDWLIPRKAVEARKRERAA